MLGPISVLICLCVWWMLASAQQLVEDDVCKETEGASWTCKPISNCPKAQENLKNKRGSLDICNFIGLEPIVCCEPDVKMDQPSGGIKSKEKCKEYAQSVYLRLPYATVNQCAVVEPLITNGMDAESREYPHMALIGYGEKNAIEWICGGSLISKRFILSAAHCTSIGQKRFARWARLGDFNFQSEEDDKMGLAGSVEYEIIERIVHPQYKEPSTYNDIALYKLDKDVEFTQFIRPICLQTEHEFGKLYAIATGWGRTLWGGKQSNILQKVNLTITPKKDCSDAYKPVIGPKLSEGIRDISMLCAGDLINGKDTCQGDSGGPLQIRLKDPYCMYSQIGVTSFGSKCAGNKPGVYTRVSYFVPWIESVVWP